MSGPDHWELLQAVNRDLIPFNQLLGVTVDVDRDGELVVGFTAGAEMVGNLERNTIHGGVVSAVLDAAGGLTVLCALLARSAGRSMQQAYGYFASLNTVNLRIDYLRRVFPGPHYAKAGLIQLGKRLAVVRMRLLRDTGPDLAHGTAVYLLAPGAERIARGEDVSANRADRSGASVTWRSDR